MGLIASCCGSSKHSSKGDINTEQKDVPIPNDNILQSSAVSEATTNIPTSIGILDDTLKTEITDVIKEDIATVPAKYQHERDRLVDEMQRAAPERYLGLLYSEYPEVNGPTVNQMARKTVTSTDVKQRLIDQVDKQIESSVRSRTADWDPSSREAARPVVRAFIEKCVNEEFNAVELE